MRKNIAAQLDTVHSVIGATLSACAKTNKSAELKKELNTASHEIAKVVTVLQESAKSRSFMRTRKSLAAIGTTMESLSEGLDARELTVSEFRAVCSSLQTKFIPKFVQSLANEVSNLSESDLEVPEETAPAVKITSVVPRVKQSLSAGGKVGLAEQMARLKQMLNTSAPEEDPEDDLDDEPEESEEERAERLEGERELERMRREDNADISSIEVMLTLRKKRMLLPLRLTKISQYSIVKLPLVPIFPDNFKITEERNLKRLGIKHTIIQGYAFLEEQLILCVSRTEIEKMNSSTAESSKVKVKAKVGQQKVVHETLGKQAVKLAERANEHSTNLFKLNLKLNPLSTLASKLKVEIAEINLKLKGGKDKEGKIVKPLRVEKNITAAKKKLEIAQEKLKPIVAKINPLAREADELKQMLSAVQNQIAEKESEIKQREVTIHNTKKLLKPKEAHVSPVDYALTVLSHINEISSSAYTLVTPEFKVNIRNADILCFWIMPSAKLNQFFRDAGGKTKVQWSFPWDA